MVIIAKLVPCKRHERFHQKPFPIMDLLVVCNR
jgi:hypothetical protein